MTEEERTLREFAADGSATAAWAAQELDRLRTALERQARRGYIHVGCADCARHMRLARLALDKET
jgi:hypothetical protein